MLMFVFFLNCTAPTVIYPSVPTLALRDALPRWPGSGQWPERMATRALAEPTLWDAGTHLMQRASRASGEGIVAAANLARDNRETIEACGAAAAKAKKTVRCTIEVKPANNDR